MTRNQNTVRVELTPAEARIAIQALSVWESVIAGDVDGFRRTPWDHFAMDVDEGENVPEALTRQSGYMTSLDKVRDALGKASQP